jgi:hypothetical protein
MLKKRFILTLLKAYWISKMSIPVIENVTKVGRENVTE